MKTLAIWTQDFKELKRNGLFYLDKTKYIQEIVGSKNKYFFFSRPRRFWKSILCSTIKYLFLGEKELFKDTYLYDKWNWEEEKYPVIYLSFSSYPSNIIKNWKEFFIKSLKTWCYIEYEEKRIYFDKLDTILNIESLSDILDYTKEYFKQEKVVMIIDEYDKAVLSALWNIEIADKIREYSQQFYSWIKDRDESIRLFFMTGLTKFMKMNLFSVLNNLDDISYLRKWSKLVWFTQEEIERDLWEKIEILASEYQLSYEETVEKIKIMYNWYNFWNKKATLYNPWDINNLLDNYEFNYYWSDTWIPSSINNTIKNNEDLQINKLVESVRDKDLFLSSMDLKVEKFWELKAETLFFYGWYLTIDYKDESWNIYLKFPNKETEEVFSKYFAHLVWWKNDLLNWVVKLWKELVNLLIKNNNLLKNKEKEFEEILNKYYNFYLKQFPWEWADRNPEWWIKTMFWLLYRLSWIKWWWEIAGLDVRVDSFIPLTENKLIILEYKVNKTTGEAIKQIEDNYEQQAISLGYEVINKIWINWKREEKKIEIEIK